MRCPGEGGSDPRRVVSGASNLGGEAARIAGSLPPFPGPRSAKAGRASVRKSLAVNELSFWGVEHRNGDWVKTAWI